MTPEARLKELGLTLPPAPRPVGAYVPCVRAGDLLFVSGQLPMRDAVLSAKGKVGSAVTVDQGAKAARTAGLNALAQVASMVGGLVNVVQIVRVGVFVNSAPGFTDQAKVANGVSDLLVSIFGEQGRHARAAVGVNELPLDASVEVELVVQIRT